MLDRIVIGVIGSGGEISPETFRTAERLGELIAGKGWVLLNGGRNTGVMEASARGAKRRGGLTVGILPTHDHQEGGTSASIDIPIYTGMGDARNVINVLSSDILIACDGNEGTVSEVAVALKNGKRVVFLGFDDRGLFQKGRYGKQVSVVGSPEEAIEEVERVLKLERKG